MSSPRTQARKRPAQPQFPFTPRPSHLPEAQPEKPDPIQVGYLSDEFIDSLTYKQAYAWTSGLDGTVRKNASLKDRRSFLKSLRDLTQRTIHRAKEGWAVPASSSSSQSSRTPAPKRRRVGDSAEHKEGDVNPPRQQPVPPPANAHVGRVDREPPQQPPLPQVHDWCAPPPKDSMNKIRNSHNGMNLAPMTSGPPPMMNFREQVARYRPDFDDRYDLPPRRSNGYRYRSRSHDHRSPSRGRSDGRAQPGPYGQPENGPHHAWPAPTAYSGPYVDDPQPPARNYPPPSRGAHEQRYAPPVDSRGRYSNTPMNGPQMTPNNGNGTNSRPMQQPQHPYYQQQDRQQPLSQQQDIVAYPPAPAGGGGRGGAPSTPGGYSSNGYSPGA